jgi:hypothetical protein
MPVSRRVECVNKPTNRSNPHQRITHLGGYWGPYGTRAKVTEDEAIRDIENDWYKYHVVAGGRDVNIFVSSHNGHKYLRTTSDDTTKDNLLSLPECP